MSIVWFDQEADARMVGGKGFRLCQLAQAGFPVLPGFCVSVDSMHTISVRDLETALEHLGTPVVAVRSSAVEEDSRSASFAGIYLTRLNVTTPEAVQHALEEVRESASSPAALAYLQRRGLERPSPMAAVVQKFLMPDASGVLFLRDPVTNSDRIIVEASWGLGEAVVGGTVTPDRWVLLPDGSIISSEISDKNIAMVADETGTKLIEVDPERRRIPCIDVNALYELVDLGRRCERLLGSPQDIEWAIASNTVWLLQSRPITRI